MSIESQRCSHAVLNSEQHWPPQGLSTASGGLSWPRIASISSSLPLYNYAVSGAVCSNSITPRYFSAISAPFPDIAGYELPAFIADSKHVNANGTKFFKNKPAESVYAIWIGTNDLGNDAFLTDSQVRGKKVTDYVSCVFDTVDALYKNGGRYFVLLNVAPLELLPQYALPEMGGREATKFFADKTKWNATNIYYDIQETVATVNELFRYRAAVEVELEERWKGARVAGFDVNSLVSALSAFRCFSFSSNLFLYYCFILHSPCVFIY